MRALTRGVLWLAVVLALSLVVRPSRAVEYEVFVRIETEEDLYDLLLDEQIGEETFQTLLELLQRGVDPNTASRDDLYLLPNLTYADVDALLAYRDDVVRVRAPAELAAAGVLPPDKARAIRPFLRDKVRPLQQTEGWARLQVRRSVGDAGGPATALQARVRTLQHLTVGAAAVGTRHRLAGVAYDPVRDSLAADAPRYRPVVPKYYAWWDTPDASAIVGTYRIGFGQRLTFDTTSHYAPHGIYPDEALYRVNALTRLCRESAGELEQSPCAGDAGQRYVMPDFRWTDRLRGAAAGVKLLPIGRDAVSAYAFGSYEAKDVYQYQTYDRRFCDDPASDDPGCAAPPVFRRRDDPLEPTSRFSTQTLPDLYTETLAGGNLTYHVGRRVRFGVTGYRSSVRWGAREMDLDFQDWARTPYGGPFGAVGADAAWGEGPFDTFVEVARSFDAMPGGGGGLGAISRSVIAWDRNEIEVSGRHYDTRFANPYARPISAATRYDGLRARDETGARVRHTGRLGRRLHLRSSVDTFRAPSSGRAGVLATVRSDVRLARRWQAGLWTEAQDKDVRVQGRGQCFQSPSETDEEGEPVPCAGRRYRVVGRLRFAPSGRAFVAAQLRHDWLDDGRYPDRFRRDLAAWLTLGGRPHEAVRLRVRSRYLFEDVSDAAYLERSLWTFADARVRLGAVWLGLRYDLLVRLDTRESTRTRQPSPEQWLSTEVEARF
jgi:hypothetical protein